MIWIDFFEDYGMALLAMIDAWSDALMGVFFTSCGCHGIYEIWDEWDMIYA